MTKTAKQAIMDYFGIDLVPESLLKELGAITSEQVIGNGRQLLVVSDDHEHWNGGYASVSEQRQALQIALYGKDEK